jgi:hypothetical protein
VSQSRVGLLGVAGRRADLLEVCEELLLEDPLNDLDREVRVDRVRALAERGPVWVKESGVCLGAGGEHESGEEELLQWATEHALDQRATQSATLLIAGQSRPPTAPGLELLLAPRRRRSHARARA